MRVSAPDDERLLDPGKNGPGGRASSPRLAGFGRSALNLARGRLPAYTRNWRHLQLLSRYATSAKLANIVRAELARMRGDISLRSKPYIYTVDVGNICNLRCPLCPTGVQGLGRPQGFMSVDDFEAVLEQIKPWAIEVVLHNWGEPFLHPRFLDLVRASRAAGVGTATSTNLNLVRRGSDFLREVVDSGLDHLVVSIDGTTPEVYESYRRGGNLEHVLTNLKDLIAHKRAVRSKTPVIEWQFLMMKHNQHQADDARRLAAELGVDQLRFLGAGLPFEDLADVDLGEKWLPEDPEYRGYDPAIIRDRGYLYDEGCFYLYRAMTVNPSGEVAPCCAVHHSKWDFGNLLESGLEQVWNNPLYQSSRALFSSKGHAGGEETVCHVCPLFKYESSGKGQCAGS